MLKVEVVIRRSEGHHKDKVTGLGIELEGLIEEDQVDQLEVLFSSCIHYLFPYTGNRGYKLEITERE